MHSGQNGPPFEGQTPAGAAPPEQIFQAPPQANIPLSMVGAALGAGVGAAIWFGIAYATNYEIGFVAILVGALAGWGAALLGGARNTAVGIIAATFGVVGIVGGSYANFHLQVHGDAAKEELRQVFYDQNAGDPEFAALSPAEKEATFEMFYELVMANITYVEYLKQETRDLLFMLLFGGLGLYYGFRVGAGITKEGSVW
jgi:hypothetical protein